VGAGAAAPSCRAKVSVTPPALASMRVIFAMGCKSHFWSSALTRQAKANLHPPAFYTQNFTSPPMKTGLVKISERRYHIINSFSVC
jgi:hypothetical protein